MHHLLLGHQIQIFSTNIQETAADAAAVCVLINAKEATDANGMPLIAPPAEPALNPNQPNHNNDAPSTTNGVLCGFMCSVEL